MPPTSSTITSQSASITSIADVVSSARSTPHRALPASRTRIFAISSSTPLRARMRSRSRPTSSTKPRPTVPQPSSPMRARTPQPPVAPARPPAGATTSQPRRGVAVGIEHPLDARMLAQHGGALLGVRAVPVDAQAEGLDAAQDQEAVLRAGDAADGVLEELQLRPERLIVGDDGAAEGVA